MPREWRTTTTILFPFLPPAYSRARLTTLSFIIREKTEEYARKRAPSRKEARKEEGTVRARARRKKYEPEKRGAARVVERKSQWRKWRSKVGVRLRLGEVGVGCSMNKRARARGCRRIRMTIPNGGRSSSRRGSGWVETRRILKTFAVLLIFFSKWVKLFYDFQRQFSPRHGATALVLSYFSYLSFLHPVPLFILSSTTRGVAASRALSEAYFLVGSIVFSRREFMVPLSFPRIHTNFAAYGNFFIEKKSLVCCFDLLIVHPKILILG